MCQPGWEGNLRENGYMRMCGWVSSLFTWIYHNIVNRVYPPKMFWVLNKWIKCFKKERVGIGEVIQLLKSLLENRPLGLFRVVLIFLVYHPCCQVGCLTGCWRMSQRFQGFPYGSAGKESTCNAGDLCLTPGLGRFPGEGKGYPLQYSGRENSADCIVHGVPESDMTEQLMAFTFLAGQLPLLVVGRMSQRFQGDTLWREAFSEVTFSVLKGPSFFFVLRGLCCSTCGGVLPSGGDRGDLQLHKGFWALSVAKAIS